MRMIRHWQPTYNLLNELVKKDLKTRYARPSLGFLWSFVSPLLMVIVFYVVFGLILKVERQGIPFVLYLMSGIFPWMFFQNSVLQSTTSLVDNRNLIKESRLPHWLIPLSIVLANGISFLPSLGILIMMAFFVLKGIPFSLVFLPLVFLLHLILAVSVSLIASICFVRWRDTKNLLEPFMQMLFYSTPVFYSLDIVKKSCGFFWFNIFLHNPFVGILNMYRLAILKGFGQSLDSDVSLNVFLITPLCFSILLLLLGFYIYHQNRSSLNDYLSY